MGGVLVGYWINPPDDSERGRISEPPADTVPQKVPDRPDTPAQPDPEPERPKARVAIVIDDVGWSREAAPVFADVREYLTFALLPGRPYSQDLYDRWANESSFLIHMPMEPKGYPEDDPGELALMTSMSAPDVSARLEKVLERYPEIDGINNHMGSEFTANRELMGAVMDVLSRRDLFYLDSRTSAESVAVDEARRRGVTVAQNQVFLDNERTEAAVRSQLKKLVERAREEGSAIGIGHFQSMETARVLREEIPRYRKQGVAFVSLREIMDASPSRPSVNSSVSVGQSAGDNRL